MAAVLEFDGPDCLSLAPGTLAASCALGIEINQSLVSHYGSYLYLSSESGHD